MFCCFASKKSKHSLPHHQTVNTNQPPFPQKQKPPLGQQQRQNQQQQQYQRTFEWKEEKQEPSQNISSKTKPLQKIVQIESDDGERAEEGSDLLSSDCSVTIPYLTKKQMSEVSTPKRHRSHCGSGLKRASCQLKYGSIHNEEQHREIGMYYSKNRMEEFLPTTSLKPSTSLKPLPSIDYSRYSEQDKRVLSSEILDLDGIQEQMKEFTSSCENDDGSFFQENQEKRLKSTPANPMLGSQRCTQKTPDCSKLHQFHQSNSMTPTFQSVFNAPVQNITLPTNIDKTSFSNQVDLISQKRHSRKKTHKFTLIQPANEGNQEKVQKTEADLLIEKTIGDELQGLTPELSSKWMNGTELKTYRKDFQEETSLDETLQSIKNAFYCDSVQEQFIRALIQVNLLLAEAIYEGMPSSEKNQPDAKGFRIIDIVILLAAVQAQYIDLAKKMVKDPCIDLNSVSCLGWRPLQECISTKNLKLTPAVFLWSHKKKLEKIQNQLNQASQLLSSLPDFKMELQIKVESNFIPLISHMAPSDTITITKSGSSLWIDYSLVGYEFLSCKRRDMGFYFQGVEDTSDEQNSADKKQFNSDRLCYDSNPQKSGFHPSIYLLNRSKKIYTDLLQELDNEEMQMLIVQSLQSETKKINPIIEDVSLKKSKSIFDNQIQQEISGRQCTKHQLSVRYTSTTEKRLPAKKQAVGESERESASIKNSERPQFLSTWENYQNYPIETKIKPKNKHKKIDLQLWLAAEQGINLQSLARIFDLFALSNPLAKILSDFFSNHLCQLDNLKGKFPVKIDIPIEYSLFFNIQFKDLVYQSDCEKHKQTFDNLRRVRRKEFQNLAESREKRAFAIGAFT